MKLREILRFDEKRQITLQSIEFYHRLVNPVLLLMEMQGEVVA